ncbi:MAG TPA: VOC family protein [Gaiellales bacterium]|nr:VOC family protein [Gaiellales bacterium]
MDEPIRVDERRLMVERVAAANLAKQFGTPLYVISEAQLRANVRAWRAALAAAWRHGDARVLVSLKANPSLALRRILNDEGAGCDVYGASELEVALRSGVDPAVISVNGSTKSPALVERTITAGARLTADSMEEVEHAALVAHERGIAARVRIRLRPDMTDVESISDFTEQEPLGRAADAYKPGIPTDVLLERIGSVDLRGVELTGVHAHLGRHTTGLSAFTLHAERVGRLAGLLSDALGGWRPAEIDLGGGYSFPGDPTGRALRGLPDAPAPAEYAAALVDGLIRGLEAGGLDPEGIALEIEPGRAVYGSAGLHLTRVLHVKRQAAPAPRVWVGCDTSEVLLSDTTWEHSRWEPVPAAPLDGELVTADIVGISCGFDTITPDARIPSGIGAGDVLAFLATGAYEDALAGNFNSMPRPATVLVSGDGVETIRRRETLDDVLRRDRVPARLSDGQAVRGIDHVSFTVQDLDRSIAFYCDLLGLTVRDRGRLEPGLIEQMTGVPDAVVDFADILAGSRVIELLEFRSPRQRPAPRTGGRIGVVHVGLAVDDAGAAHRRLAAAGHEPLSEPVLLPDDGSDWSGALVFYVRDPDGTMLEIVERSAQPVGASTPVLAEQPVRSA